MLGYKSIIRAVILRNPAICGMKMSFSTKNDLRFNQIMQHKKLLGTDQRTVDLHLLNCNDVSRLLSNINIPIDENVIISKRFDGDRLCLLNSKSDFDDHFETNMPKLDYCVLETYIDKFKKDGVPFDWSYDLPKTVPSSIPKSFDALHILDSPLLENDDNDEDEDEDTSNESPDELAWVDEEEKEDNDPTLIFGPSGRIDGKYFYPNATCDDKTVVDVSKDSLGDLLARVGTFEPERAGVSSDASPVVDHNGIEIADKTAALQTNDQNGLDASIVKEEEEEEDVEQEENEDSEEEEEEEEDVNGVAKLN